MQSKTATAISGYRGYRGGGLGIKDEEWGGGGLRNQQQISPPWETAVNSMGNRTRFRRWGIAQKRCVGGGGSWGYSDVATEEEMRVWGRWGGSVTYREWLTQGEEVSPRTRWYTRGYWWWFMRGVEALRVNLDDRHLYTSFVELCF